MMIPYFARIDLDVVVDVSNYVAMDTDGHPRCTSYLRHIGVDQMLTWRKWHDIRYVSTWPWLMEWYGWFPHWKYEINDTRIQPYVVSRYVN